MISEATLLALNYLAKGALLALAIFLSEQEDKK